MNINDTLHYLNTGLPDDILRKKIYGDFEGAVRLIDRRLAADNLPEALRYCLTAQREICLRLPSSYPYDRQDALRILIEHIPDFSEEEFDTYIDTGKIGWIYINGQVHIADSFFDTLCKTSSEFAKRAGINTPETKNPADGTAMPDIRDITMCEMKKHGKIRKKIRIHASIKIKDDCFSPGMNVLVHLPVPAECEQQSEIEIEKIFPENGILSPEDASARTICWKEIMSENHEFSVEYAYTHTAVYHNTEDPSHLPHHTETSEDLGQYLIEEAPHIVFTPYIRSLAAVLTEGITDPLEKARRFYDFITLNMKYSFMPEYFVLDNISESCARNYTGDCGVFALLFITLCRCSGIPACWQSGLAAEPDFCGPHDWARFYIPPYGWLYADPSYGTGAVRAGNEERRRFYFGNLDACRMVANNAFQAPFTIEKEHWRADPYDNQVGEIETDSRGLRYEEFECSQETLLCEDL